MQIQQTPFSHRAISKAPARVEPSHINTKSLDTTYAFLFPLQRLDIYLPENGKGPYPVILAFHGGAFMGCDKDDHQFSPILKGLEHSYAVVYVNYRVSGEAKFPALIYDVKAALRWVRGNAAQYNFNPNKIAVWDDLAGEYLSTRFGTSEGNAELEDIYLGNADQLYNVQAAATWFGPLNIITMNENLAASSLLITPCFRHNEGNSPESIIPGRKTTEISGKVKAANQETNIRSNLTTFLIQHGTLDPVIPVQHSIELPDKLKHMSGQDKLILELLENVVHRDGMFETPKNVFKVPDFMDNCFKSLNDTGAWV